MIKYIKNIFRPEMELRQQGNFYYYEVKVPLKQRLMGKGK